MVSKKLSNLFLQGFVLLVLFFGMIQIIVSSQGLFMALELVGLLFLLLLSVAGFLHYKKASLLSLVFLLYIFNLVAIWYFYQSLYVILLLASLFGFLISLPKKKSAPKSMVVTYGNEPHSQVFEPLPPAKEVVVKPAESETKFTPGKYVASKRSNVYHEPKCDWAKKIQKDRQLWFTDRKEALNKGYKKHSCVQ